MKSPVAIFCLFLFSVIGNAHAQKHTYDFLFDPSGLVINPFCELYSYSDEKGWLWTARSRESHLSSNRPIGRITSSCFIDAAHGFVTGEHGMLATTDSGVTWRGMDLPQIKTSIEDVKYHYETRLLFTAVKGDGLWTSADRGKNWKKQKAGSFRGIAFNGQVGIITSETGNNSFRTTDGGLTWIRSLIPVIAAHACYSTAEQKFIAVNDFDRSLYESSDNGVTWLLRVTLEHQLLGDIFEDCGKLYVPSQNGYYFYNEGEWKHHQVSSRNPLIYCITPDAFFFSVGNPIKPTLTAIPREYNLDLVTEDEIRLTIPRCSTLTKTLSAIIAARGLYANITATILSPSGNIRITSIPDSARGMFEFTIEASSAAAGDSAMITIHARVGCKERLAYIRIFVDPAGEQVPATLHDASFPVVSTCNTDRRWIRIDNPDCNSILIESVKLRNTVTPFTLAAASKFPRSIAAQSRDSVEVVFAPSKIGAFNDFVDVICMGDDGRYTLSSRVSGTGAGAIAMQIAHDTIDFGTVTKCESVIRSTTLQNRGCDSVLIDEITLTNQSIFKITGSPLGKWLHTNEITGFTIEPDRLVPGSYNEFLTIHATSPNGSKVELYIVLTATIETPSRGYTLWSPSTVEGLTTCSSLDTIVTIRNTSTCDDLNLTTASILGDGLSIVQSNLPITLQPDDSTVIRIRFDGENRTMIDGLLAIATDLFGKLDIPLTATIIRSKLDQITAITSPTDFSTTQCAPVTKSFSFTTQGCGYLKVNDVRLASTGTSRFTMLKPNRTPPFELTEGEIVSFDIIFDPDLAGADQAEIMITGEEGIELYRSPLLGSVQNTTSTMGISMTVEAPTPMTTDDELLATVLSLSDVFETSKLQTIETNIYFDADVLTLEEITPRTNCTVQSSPIEGGFALMFTSSSGFELRTGEAIADIRFSANLSNKTSSSIELDGLVINGNDAQYLRCVMTPLPSLHTSSASIQLDCSERAVQDILRNEIAFSMGQLYPQPIESGMLKAALISRVNGPMTFTILNALGQTVYEENWSIHEGENMIALPVISLPNGAYILSISHALHKERRSFVVE